MFDGEIAVDRFNPDVPWIMIDIPQTLTNRTVIQAMLIPSNVDLNPKPKTQNQSISAIVNVPIVIHSDKFDIACVINGMEIHNRNDG